MVACVFGRQCLLWAVRSLVKILLVFSLLLFVFQGQICLLIYLYICTVALLSHASKVMLKILQARLQQYVNHELPDVQAGFRKGRGTRDQIANICWIIEKARVPEKNMYFCFIDYAKAFDCWITTNCGKFLKRWEYQTTWPASWEICMKVKK